MAGLKLGPKLELFVPLTMFDSGTWTLQRRRAHADEIIALMTSPDVIPRLASSIRWLETTAIGDRHVAELVRVLCETVKVAVWADENADVAPPPATSGDRGETWLDLAQLRAHSPMLAYREQGYGARER